MELPPEVTRHILMYLSSTEQVKCRAVSRAFKCQAEAILSSIQHITVNPKDIIYKSEAPDASIFLTDNLNSTCMRVKKNASNQPHHESIIPWLDPFLLFVFKYCPKLISFSAGDATCSVDAIQPLAYRLIYFSLYEIASSFELHERYITVNFPELKAFSISSPTPICHRELLNVFEAKSPGQFIQHTLSRCSRHSHGELILPSSIKSVEAHLFSDSLPLNVFDKIEMIRSVDRSLFPNIIPSLPSLKYLLIGGGLSDLRSLADGLIRMPKLEVWRMILQISGNDSDFNFTSTRIDSHSLKTLTIGSHPLDKAFISHITRFQRHHYFHLCIGPKMQNLTLSIHTVNFRVADSNSETLETLRLGADRLRQFNFRFANLLACHLEIKQKGDSYRISWFVNCLRHSTKLERLTIIADSTAIEAAGVRALLRFLESTTSLKHVNVSLLRVYDSKPTEAKVILAASVLQKFNYFSWRLPCSWIEFVVPPHISSIRVEDLAVTLKYNWSTLAFTGCLSELSFADPQHFDPHQAIALEWIQHFKPCYAEVKGYSQLRLISSEARSRRELCFIESVIIACSVKTIRLRIDKVMQGKTMDWTNLFHTLRIASAKPLSLEVFSSGILPMSEEVMELVADSKTDNVISSFIYQPDLDKVDEDNLKIHPGNNLLLMSAFSESPLGYLTE